MHCDLIFGVTSKSKTSTYTINVYQGAMWLLNRATVMGEVDPNEFQYFIYRTTCKKCPLLFQVSGFSNGDPDIFISKGTDGYPTRESYDFSSALAGAGEQLHIDLDTVKAKLPGTENMEDFYIIGVTSKQATSFVLQAS